MVLKLGGSGHSRAHGRGRWHDRPL